MEDLLQQIRQCTLCAKHLPLGPRPVLAASPSSRLMIIGQAPGTKVHASGIPWDDASGKRLREWMGISNEDFYNPEITGIVPMGFCYPGKSKSGDLPPRKECAPAWHEPLLKAMPQVQLTLLIGMYAQAEYLPNPGRTLTDSVKQQDLEQAYLALPHPSPRNIRWFKNNPWFEEAVLPVLKLRIAHILED